MITNYNGIVECLRDDFKYLYDHEYIKLATVKRTCNYLDLKKNDEIIINTKYNFIFNHESPNHGNLYLHENWPNGTYHFCINNFQYFIERYKRRARHFKKYLKSGNKIIFILSKINNNLETCDELKNVINEKYPNLDFDFIFMEETRHDIFNEFLTFDFV